MMRPREVIVLEVLPALTITPGAPKRQPSDSRPGHVATPFPTIPRVGIMQSSVLAAAHCIITTPSRRHSTSGGLGSARSLSPRAARLSPTVARRPASFRVCRAGQVVAAAAAKNTCSRNLLVVGPGVLGSLVCQRWLNVRLRSARVVSAVLGFLLPLASLFPRVSPLFILSDRVLLATPLISPVDVSRGDR